MLAEMQEEKPNWTKSYYLSSLASSVSSGMLAPFLSIYALKLGANILQIGLLLSLPSLASTLVQIFWASITTRVGKRKVFVIFSGIVNSIFWAVMGLCTDSSQLLILLGLQSMLSAIGAPAGSGLITTLLPKNLRGRIIAEVNKYATIGVMLGTLISGPLLDLLSFRSGYFAVFLIAALINLIGVVIFLRGIPDAEVGKKEEGLSNVNYVLKNKNLRNLIVLRSLFTISVNIAAPYFNVYLVKKYNVSNTVISSLSIASNLFSIASFNLWGEVVDKYGRVTVLTVSSMLTSVVPILWVLSDNLFLPLSSQILGGIAWSLVNVALSAYLMDVTYGGNVEVSVAFFNAAIGVSSFLGPILGGSIASYTSSLEILFYLSGSLRLITGAASFKLLQEVHPHAREITIDSIVTSFSTLHLNFERNIRRIINVLPESQTQILEKIEEKVEKVAKEDKWMWLEEY